MNIRQPMMQPRMSRGPFRKCCKITFHSMDGLEQNNIFTNQQGGRYKTFGLTIGLTDQNGMVINPDELRAMLGGRSRIPLHVSLFYSSEKDGTSKMVESKVAVGGTLKGEPLLEVKDNNGMLVSADSITPFLAVDCLTRMCIRINDVSKSHMNRRFCVRLSTLPELTVENGLSASILVRSKLVPSKKRAKLEDSGGVDMPGPKRGRGEPPLPPSGGPAGGSSEQWNKGMMGSQPPLALPQISSSGSSGGEQSAQLETLRSEVTYLRSILQDIQKHILTPAGITAFSPNAQGAGAGGGPGPGPGPGPGAGPGPLPGPRAMGSGGGGDGGLQSLPAPTAAAVTGAGGPGTQPAIKLSPLASGGVPSLAGARLPPPPPTESEGGSFSVPVSRNASASMVSATASSPPAVSSPTNSAPDLALINAAALVDKARGGGGGGGSESEASSGGAKAASSSGSSGEGKEGQSKSGLERDAELVQMIRRGSKDGATSD